MDLPPETRHLDLNLSLIRLLDKTWQGIALGREGLIELAAAGQAVCVTPFTLAGAMAPATLAGALVLQNAEVLACVVLIQLVRSGAPLVYGSFTSNVDMRSGSPAFGTPEYIKAAQASGQRPATTGCRSGRRTRPHRTRSMRRRCTRARCRCGAQSWAAPIW